MTATVVFGETMAASGVATLFVYEGSRRTAPEESRRSASSGVRAQPSCRHESTAALSIGIVGGAGSGGGGAAGGGGRGRARVLDAARRTAARLGGRQGSSRTLNTLAVLDCHACAATAPPPLTSH